MARAENGRGLAVMCDEFERHMKPDRVLVVRHPSTEALGFPPRLDRYPGAPVVTVQPPGLLDESVVRPWLRGLDVAYMAETPYDWRVIDWCRQEGVRSVVHAMPESWPANPPSLPDAVWNPTPWLHDRLPAGSEVVPVPVPDDRVIGSLDHLPTGGRLRLLHVVGHRAWGDRNGTNVLFRALTAVKEPVMVRVATQDAALPAPSRLPRGVSVEVRTGGVEDRWSLYDGFDALVMPRRHGGLSLPVQEAMARGLAVLMTDCPPNREWPVVPLKATLGAPVRLSASLAVRPHNADPAALARTIDRLAQDRGELRSAQADSFLWARENTWAALRPLYEETFERVVSACSMG